MNASPKITIKTANAPTQKLVHLLYLIPTPNVLLETKCLYDAKMVE